jgi:hypothetical protein
VAAVLELRKAQPRDVAEIRAVAREQLDLDVRNVRACR